VREVGDGAMAVLEVEGVRNCSARCELISESDSFMESEEREYLAMA